MAIRWIITFRKVYKVNSLVYYMVSGNGFDNKRNGMVLFRIWIKPEELEFLLSSTDGEKINQLFNDIKSRGDIV